MTSQNDIITDIFKVRFLHKQFEKTQFGESRNVKSSESKNKGRWGRSVW